MTRNACHRYIVGTDKQSLITFETDLYRIACTTGERVRYDVRVTGTDLAGKAFSAYELRLFAADLVKLADQLEKEPQP